MLLLFHVSVLFLLSIYAPQSYCLCRNNSRNIIYVRINIKFIILYMLCIKVHDKLCCNHKELIGFFLYTTGCCNTVVITDVVSLIFHFICPLN